MIKDAKELADIFQKIGKREQFKEILKLDDEVEKLKKENKELREKLEFKEDIEFRDNAYWKKSSGDGPYCSACWDDKSKMIRLLPTDNYGNFYECEICGNKVNVTGKQNPPIRITTKKISYI